MMRLRIAEVAKKNKGWTMLMLAQELGLDHQTVMCWNQGRTAPRFPTLIKICRLLGCTVEDLLYPDEVEAALQAGEPDDFENGAGNIPKNIPVRRKGHAPQIVTSHGCRMGSV